MDKTELGNIIKSYENKMDPQIDPKLPVVIRPVPPGSCALTVRRGLLLNCKS